MRYVAALLILASCMSDVADRYYADTRTPHGPTQVEVLMRRPDRPFRVIADFQARRASVDYMRNKAAGVGADAVIIARIGGTVPRYGETATGTQAEDFRENLHTIYGHLTGTAIIYE